MMRHDRYLMVVAALVLIALALIAARMFDKPFRSSTPPPTSSRPTEWTTPTSIADARSRIGWFDGLAPSGDAKYISDFYENCKSLTLNIQLNQVIEHDRDGRQLGVMSASLVHKSTPDSLHAVITIGGQEWYDWDYQNGLFVQINRPIGKFKGTRTETRAELPGPTDFTLRKFHSDYACLMGTLSATWLGPTARLPRLIQSRAEKAARISLGPNSVYLYIINAAGARCWEFYVIKPTGQMAEWTSLRREWQGESVEPGDDSVWILRTRVDRGE